MTEDELKKEAEDWLNKWELCNKCENKVDCISNFSYCKNVVLQSYLVSAEPREKRIAELEAQIEKMKCCGNCKRQCSFLFQDEIDCANNGLPKWEIKEK